MSELDKLTLFVAVKTAGKVDSAVEILKIGSSQEILELFACAEIKLRHKLVSSGIYKHCDASRDSYV